MRHTDCCTGAPAWLQTARRACRVPAVPRCDNGKASALASVNVCRRLGRHVRQFLDLLKLANAIRLCAGSKIPQSIQLDSIRV